MVKVLLHYYNCRVYIKLEYTSLIFKNQCRLIDK